MLDFTRDTIFDIVTCNPFSNRGKKSLGRLALDDIVTKKSFFSGENKLFVDSKYKYKFDETPTELDEDFHDFSSNFKSLKDHNSIHRKLKDFESRFLDNESDLLCILGPSGSGKTIYVNYLLWKRRQQFKVNHNEIMLDLEKLSIGITFGEKTITAPKSNATWLFCIHLFDVLSKRMVEIAENSDISEKVMDYYYCVFCNDDIGGHLDHKYHDIMDGLRGFIDLRDTDKRASERYLVEELCTLIDYADAENTIKQLLWVLVILTYCEACAHSEEMSFFIIDNIERYVEVRNNKTTEIYDEDIRAIYHTFNKTIIDTRTFFIEICKIKFMEHFKFVFVMRNSTVKQWYESVQEARDIYQNAVEISGWFDFHQIWETKIQIILPLIREDYPDEIDKYSSLFNTIICDNQSETKGNSFIEMSLEMFNNSIRRAATSFSAITFELYDILYSRSQKKLKSISIETYNEFWKNENAKVCRFLLRRTLFEQIFRLIVSKANWKNMLLDDISMTISTLLQRIILFLVRRTDKYYNISLDNYISLYDLICGVFVIPSRGIRGTNLNYNKHFRPLAKILLAMNQPLYSNTSWSPLCVLAIDRDISKHPNPVDKLARVFSEIWDSIKNNPDNFDDQTDEEKNILRVNCGIRLTRAGFAFIHFISDYPFYLANVNSENIPLLYNADHVQVINAINSVFERAKSTIATLNRFDRTFFNGNSNIRKNPVDRYRGGYLLLRNQEYEESIQQRILYDHHRFLMHYKGFVEQFGVKIFGNLENSRSVIAGVNILIKQYEIIHKEEKDAGRIDKGVRLYNI